MKIKQATAHYVESDKQDVSIHAWGPYTRVELPNGEIHWLMTPPGYEPTSLHAGKLLTALEHDFRETNGVMHEQLELPLNYE